MREPYNITFNQHRNTVTMPPIEFVVGDYMTCPLVFKWMKNDLEAFNHIGNKIYLVVKTPSGKSVDDRVTINDPDAGISNILLKQEFITEPGLYRAELQAIDIESGIVRMTSPSFSYNMRKSLQDSNTEEAKNKLTQLQEALEMVADIDVDAKIGTHDTKDVSHENIIGLLSNLTTDEKANLVAAINEVKTQSNETATDLNAHKVEAVTDGGGVHGLKIESGIWTPTLTIGGQTTGITYNIQQGRYIKTNDEVYISLDIELSSKGDLTGELVISGLPFTRTNTPVPILPINYFLNVTPPPDSIAFYSAVAANTTSISASKNLEIPISFRDTHITNDSKLRISGTYHI